MSKLKPIFILLLIIASLTFRACAPTSPAPAPATQETSTPAQTSAPTPTPTLTPVSTPKIIPTPTPSTKITPAEFKVTSLVVTPIVTEPGKPVTVEVKVTNAGGTAGSTSLALTVNGKEEAFKDVTVTHGKTETTTFALTKDASGIYEIKVAGFTETLRVREPGTYPRLANLYAGVDAFYWKAQQFTPSQVDSMLKLLARWDIVAVDANVAWFAPDYLRKLKKLNPRVKILAVIGAGAGGYWRWMLTDGLEAPNRPGWITPEVVSFVRKQAEYYGITAQDSNESFFLHYGNTPGNSKPPEQRRWILWTSEVRSGDDWPGMNPNSDWSTYLPHLVKDKLMSTGLFDGVWYDCFLETMWAPNLDIDNDGIGDSLNFVNQKYREGMTRLLQITRELLGPDAIIIGNPGSEWSANSPFFNYANGHIQECALGIQSWSNRDFAKVWEVYERNMQTPAPPSRINWIDADTNNVKYDPFDTNLPPTELQKMRYGLSIALLDDGYYGFDIGNEFHNTIWWFPEYDANLGLAKGKAQKRTDGTWIREFQNGVVVVNPAGSTSTIKFNTIYQDVTTGIKGISFTVQPQDGRIFLKSG